jgi:glycyl-tRNA synthetase
VGTPFCLTIDGQTIQDQTVTVRDRDTLVQERVAADRLREFISSRIGLTFRTGEKSPTTVHLKPIDPGLVGIGFHGTACG